MQSSVKVNDGDPSSARHSTDSSSYMSNFQNILAAGKEPVMTKVYKPQVAFEFENYSNPQSLKQHVLRSEKIRKIIDFYSQVQNCSRKKIERQAKDIIDEIGLDRNMAIIRWCGVAITAIGKRISSGIYVNEASMSKVKQGLGRYPVLYLPTHRSYMDFILMSYICFHYEIEIPGIAAGMDFHSMFGIGTMLRKTGAFFMRRSFSNDEMYWDIFREYMYALVAAYHIGVEFFIEGTRSRNFKALVPKIGLLSMALLPYFTGEVSDITIVPVSVSYERLLEEQLFVYELLGVPKPKESTKGFFKALKIIDERFGKMYLDFGEPISVREFFGHTSEDRLKRAAVGAHLQKLSKHEIELIKGLANEIVFQQQKRVVITTFNLLSLFFASRSYCTKTSAILDELANGVLRLKDIFEALGAHVATKANCIKVDVIETVEIHSNILHLRNGQLHRTQLDSSQLAQEIDVRRLKAHALSPNTMAIALPTLALQLYINPCLFWLARPAFLITAAMHMAKYGKNNFSTQADLLANLFQRVSSIYNIFKYEFIIESRTEDFERNLKFLVDHDVVHFSSSQTTELRINENECSRIILSAFAPLLCVYYQLAVTLNEFSETGIEFSSNDVFIRLQRRIEALMEQNVQQNVHPYCLALDNISIALHSFVQAGYLLKNKDGGLIRNYNITTQTFPNATNKSLANIETQLLQYCNLMPFKFYYEAASDDAQMLPSKL